MFVGAMVRWTKAFGVDVSNDPLWCIVVDHDDGTRDYWDVPLLGGSHVSGRLAKWGDRDQFSWPIEDHDHATAEIIPEDEWPDEVCTALAKWRLTYG
jgi:hypothetical protein